MIQTDFFGICITPEDFVAVPEVCHPYSIASALGRHQRSYKAPVYIGHHHITPVGENELWHSSWKTKIPDLRSELISKNYSYGNIFLKPFCVIVKKNMNL